MSVSYHYINGEFELKSGILDFMPFPGTHTGEGIARKMLETLIKFGIVNFGEDMLNEKDELSKEKYKGKSIHYIHHMYTFICMS